MRKGWLDDDTIVNGVCTLHEPANLLSLLGPQNRSQYLNPKDRKMGPIRE